MAGVKRCGEYFGESIFEKDQKKGQDSPETLHAALRRALDLQRFYTFPVDGPFRWEYDGKNTFGGAAMKKKTTFGK